MRELRPLCLSANAMKYAMFWTALHTKYYCQPVMTLRTMLQSGKQFSLLVSVDCMSHGNPTMTIMSHTCEIGRRLESTCCVGKGYSLHICDVPWSDTERVSV